MSDSPLPPFGALPRPTPGPRPPRNRRYLRALWILSPLLVLALGAGLAGLALQATAAWARSQGDWARAEAIYSHQPLWVGRYNEGTALLHQGRSEEAIDRLELAFDQVPRALPDADGRIQAYTYECQVRLNLAAGWDQLAATQSGDEAEASTRQGQNWAEPCQDPQSSSSEDESDQPSEGESGADQPEPAPADPFEGETPEEQARREELEQRNQEQQEREREKEESQNRDRSPRGW